MSQSNFFPVTDKLGIATWKIPVKCLREGKNVPYLITVDCMGEYVLIMFLMEVFIISVEFNEHGSFNSFYSRLQTKAIKIVFVLWYHRSIECQNGRNLGCAHDLSLILQVKKLTLRNSVSPYSKPLCVSSK